MDRFDCTLWEFLKDESKYQISSSERVTILLEITEVVILLQSEGICHRDLKPSNIFLRTKIASNGKFEIIPKQWVLGDFGISCEVAKLSGCKGTPGFAPMEQFIRESHKKSDNYSLAKLAVLILFKWNVAWNLLARPIPATENIPWAQSRLFKLLSAMLSVSYIQYESILPKMACFRKQFGKIFDFPENWSVYF